MNVHPQGASPPDRPEARGAARPERWVEEHGDVLYRYAIARVRKPEVAEDLVQDTLLAAVRTAERFEGRSTERSWLCGILKHKICDYFRKRGRETPFTDLEFLKDEMPQKFTGPGYWIHELGPREWHMPEDVVTFREEFWQTLRGCLEKLGPRVADVFMLREMEEMETSEICEALQITQSNLYVMLHRARMALRECLEVHWFGKAPPTDA